MPKFIDDISLNIDKPIIQNNNIQMKIDNTSESISTPTQSRSYASAASPSNAALSIVDDLADWEIRKKNAIIYNFPKASDRQADRGALWTCAKRCIILILVSIKWCI